MTGFRDRLRDSLRDPEYRYAYADSLLNSWIAAQIKAIREQRGFTQQELAERLGTKQAGVSRLENVNYSAWKTETLRKIARALDVRLRITFEGFGTVLDDAERFSRRALERPDFETDPDFSWNIPVPEIAAFGSAIEQPRKQEERTAPSNPFASRPGDPLASRRVKLQNTVGSLDEASSNPLGQSSRLGGSGGTDPAKPSGEGQAQRRSA